MRKLWIIPVLFAAIGILNTRADSITDGTINFTLTVGAPLPTTGSFVYDDTSNQFLNFTVGWDELTFNLTSAANSPTITAGGPACISGDTGAQATLALMDVCDTAGAYWDGTSPTMPVHAVPTFAFVAAGPLPGPQLITMAVFYTSPTTDTRDVGLGSYVTTTTTNMPEPGAGSLLLSGLGIVFVLAIRQRKGLSDSVTAQSISGFPS
jgi:hypothetical protein